MSLNFSNMDDNMFVGMIYFFNFSLIKTTEITINWLEFVQVQSSITKVWGSQFVRPQICEISGDAS